MLNSFSTTHRQLWRPLFHTCLSLATLVTFAAAADAQLTASGVQWLPGPEAHERMGEAMVFCDFDGDGDDELAVGIPDSDVETPEGTQSNAGAVRIFSADETGDAVEAAGSPFHQSDLPLGQVDAGDNFGAALAAADFDLDGACDLVIGIPGADVDGLSAAGRVAVIYGRLGEGLNLEDIAWFDQSVLTGTLEIGDRFGSVLAAGPVGHNPFPDLVVGVPNDRVGDFAGAGAVHLITSNDSDGLGTAFDARLHQDVTNVFGIAGPDDHFGASLAIGDLTGDDVPDLVVGTPGDRVGLVQAAGSVQVIAGGVSGVDISVETQQLLHQDVDDVLGDAAEGDAFGSAIVLGNFNGGDLLDLAVGIPFESQFGPEGSGAVQVFFGTFGGGLSVDTEQILFENLISPEIATFDRFGDVLASGDFDADGRDELVVGFPFDNVFGVPNSGNVAVLRGAGGGLQAAGAQLWNGFTLLTIEAGGNLGSAVAVGRWGGDRLGHHLAIGTPGHENPAMDDRAGGVLLLRNLAPIFADGFESGTLEVWSSSAP